MLAMVLLALPEKSLISDSALHQGIKVQVEQGLGCVVFTLVVAAGPFSLILFHATLMLMGSCEGLYWVHKQMQTRNINHRKPKAQTRPARTAPRPMGTNKMWSAVAVEKELATPSP